MIQNKTQPSQLSLAETDLIDLITGKQSAHMINHEFASDESAALWDHITQEPEYYLTHGEINLINQTAPSLPAYNCLYDLGPGASETVIKKTLPVVESITPNIYRPIDVCADFLDDAVNSVKLHNENIQCQPVISNWKDIQIMDKSLPSLVLYTGGSVGNTPFRDNDTCASAVTRHLKELHTTFSGADMLVTIDTNKYEDSLMRCYDTLSMKRFNSALWHNLAKSDNVSGLDARQIDVSPAWDQHNNRVVYLATTRTDQMISIAGQTHNWYAGETLIQSHSIKFDLAEFINFCTMAGWKFINCFDTPQSSIKMILLNS